MTLTTTYEVLKLGVEVFLDGESCVWNGLVQIRVEVANHLHHTHTQLTSHWRYMKHQTLSRPV